MTPALAAARADAVPGIALLVPAQFDLSVDLDMSGQFDHPGFQAAIAKVEKAAANAGIPLCYRVICGFDLLWLKAKTAEALGWPGKK